MTLVDTLDIECLKIIKFIFIHWMFYGYFNPLPGIARTCGRRRKCRKSRTDSKEAKLTIRNDLTQSFQPTTDLLYWSLSFSLFFPFFSLFPSLFRFLCVFLSFFFSYFILFSFSSFFPFFIRSLFFLPSFLFHFTASVRLFLHCHRDPLDQWEPQDHQEPEEKM